MIGYILYRYPGKQPKIFLVGEGDDLFYLCPFLDRSPTTFTGHIEDYKGSYIEFIADSTQPHITSHEEYLQHFNTYQKSFQENNISKAILSRIKEVECECSPANLFERLCDEYETAFCYVMSIEGVGSWAGASPEILLRYEDSMLHTVALAGTKYSDDPSVWTFKEKEEHGLVEQYIAALSTENTPLIKQTAPKVVKAGNLYHLKSEFGFRASRESVAEFLERIHPTPAICGLPFHESRDLILDTEKHDRSFYCGYIGVVEAESEEFSMYVNIRCMQLIEDMAYLYIGGGITKDSVSSDEWEETERKSRTMMDVLADF